MKNTNSDARKIFFNKMWKALFSANKTDHIEMFYYSLQRVYKLVSAVFLIAKGNVNMCTMY